MAKPPSARTALAILTGVNLLNYIDRYILAGALPLIMSAFGASDGQGGFLQLLFMVPYAVVSPLAGWLGDRKRRFQIAGAGVLVWSAATFASGLAPTFLALMLARIVIGVGEASYSVVTPALLGDYYPPQRRVRVLTIFYAALPVGSALGFVVGGVAGVHLGWRWAFFLAGIPGLALGLALLTFRDPPRLLATPDEAVSDAAPRWRELAHFPSYVFNVVSQTIYTFSLGGLAGWMPTYFARERGIPLAKADVMFGGIVCVAGFLGTIVGGQVCDAVGRRTRVAAFLVPGLAMVASAPFTWLAILSPSPAIFWPAMFVTLMLLFVNTGPLNAAMTNVLPPALRARGFGVSTMSIHLLGDALSPFLIGLASDRVGLRLPVVVTGLLPVAAGLVLMAGRSALNKDLLRAGAAA
ncbi:MAG TPA: MFS transporter [Polyangia bacterium]|jgi:MFS family permease|nr:MFS transporter [Polyangia bacterium]